MPEITPDPARVYIAVVREDLRSGYSEAAADRIREQHIPALLAAVEAALQHHQPDGHLPLYTGCRTCPGRWPCPTYEAITRELPGEVPGA
jgi:hypothetical protein